MSYAPATCPKCKHYPCRFTELVNIQPDEGLALIFRCPICRRSFVEVRAE